MSVILGRRGGGAAGGGSLPDPSGEPDGDVLTVSGGAAVWSPGGGSLPADQRGLYGGDPIEIADGGQAYLTWDSLGSGVALLDLTTPNKPLVITGGVYSVTVVVGALGALTAGGVYNSTLHLDFDNEDAICEMTGNGGNADASSVVTSLNNTWFIPAGGAIRVEVDNFDGSVARNFRLTEACLQRLS